MRRLLLFIFTMLFALSACNNNSVQKDIGIYGSSEEKPEIVAAPYETINIEEIETFVDQGYLIADVREVEEFDSGHIPGAVNAPLSDLQTGNPGLLKDDEKYVIICRSGNRSAIASDILIDLGFDIVNTREGMSSWTGDVEQ